MIMSCYVGLSYFENNFALYKMKSYLKLQQKIEYRVNIVL